ncbi:nicotinate (nicotinamide) nucleotide adenylyltransferase [Phocaeicola sartorii]|jgi:nicotinate-nucleotide adenylyltransferase|uniref:nicotinate (nicotinamide) nucleotide adenylyltransferase n=1 Tax=Phocaeicola sartorii TaxID=671267 RepID=UPI000B1767D2|nr:nicotinate (nicotinamide) nucleotide adenylyltransferase [Phocaeicola sartorii]
MEKYKIKTGIFGGSFNPVHIGHLALANYLCEYSGLDELWFLVSPHNPLKRQTDLWDDNLRLELVKLAIADYPKFRASDFEFHLPRPSYTIHTLDALQKAYPDREFILIIGADNWHLFPRWYKAEEILKNHQVMVYPRPGFMIDPGTLPSSVQLVDTPLLEISSTFIRQALAEGRDVRYFLHPVVYERLKKS